MTPAPDSTPTFQPVAPAARLLQLDVLRGLALLGVLLVNLDVFNGAMWARDAKLPVALGWGGAVAEAVVRIFLEGKAAALLGLLFGAGLAIQLEGADRKGRGYTAFALRRVGALALFGLAHSLLLWNVDILLDYALISLMVLPFLRLRPGRILWAIPVLLAVSLAIALPFLPLLKSLEQDAVGFYNLGLAHYGAGTWLEALKYRSWEFLHVLGPQRLTSRLPALLPFFILGVYFWKKGFLSEPERHRATLRALFLACFVLGLLANLLPQATLHATVAGIPQPFRALIKLTAFFARPALTVGYAAGILLLLQGATGRRILGVFAPLGRMALTQYLLQSVVCTWVFNGYGLGLYGKVSVSACLAGGLVFFALQVWSSRLWLARFPVGPAEWLWRRLSYGPKPISPVLPNLATQEPA
ncbi:MAG: DUF418 domain-containing protein [Holophagaceae bacterium]|nr:DUF418 domain-containing protein [Holophagaceae bacterium]